MAYVPNIVGRDEKLIGIARLHWIYIVSATAWFLGLTYVGTLMQGVIERFAMYISQTINSVYLMTMLMKIGDNALMVMMAIGGFILLFNVLKVIATEVGLTNRRIIYKSGLIFVKVRETDLEEIRGESLDLGNFGRLLNYGAINLDCRFIGDVKLPFISRAETFLKALHAQRAKTQDVLSIAVGKSNPTGVEIVSANPPQTPTTPPATPNTPVTPPVAPPPEAPPQTPAVPEAPPQQPPTEVPPQPVIPPQVPSQPTAPIAQTGSTAEITEATLAKLTPEKENEPQPIMSLTDAAEPPPPEVPPQPVIPPQVPSQPTAPQGQRAASLDPASVAQVVREMMPAMAQQVVKEMAEQGLLNSANDQQPKAAAEAEDLVLAFDEAALQKKANERGSVFKASYSVN